MKPFQIRRFAGVVLVLGMAQPGHAQISMDGTLGSAVALTGPNFAITADLGRQLGGNLFHSFASFNLANGQSAVFSGPGNVTNIIGRVTGAAASSIDGLLRSTIAGANLYLINPRGIAFGPNARLDLGGAFYASTANYLRLGNGGRFDATNPDASSLGTSPPEAFGFLGNASPISVDRSDLRAAIGSPMALVGGPIGVAGAGLRTFSGNLGLVATASAGEIPVDGSLTPGNGMTLAAVSVTGAATVRTNDNGVDAPGRLVIRAGQLTIENSTVASQNPGSVDAPPVLLSATGDIRISNSQVFAVNAGAGRAASLSIVGDNVLLERFARVTEARSAANATGAPGDIEITAARDLRVVTNPGDPGGSLISNTSAVPAPTGGAIRLRGDTITIQSSTVRSLVSGLGNGGPIVFDGRDIHVMSGSLVLSQTTSPGNGGPISMNGDSVEVNGSTIRTRVASFGNGGDVDITGRTVSIAGGSFLNSTTTTGSSGQGGNFRLTASQSVSMSGFDANGLGSFVQSDTFGRGAGGSISVQAPVIDLAAAFISANTNQFFGGTGGSITLIGDTIRIHDDQGRVAGIAAGTAAGSNGDSGSVHLSAGNSIVVSGWGFSPFIGDNDGSAVGTVSHGSGRSGAVIVEAPQTVLTRGGRLTSIVDGPGVSGPISVRASDLVISKGGSIVSQNQPGSSGSSGNINVDASHLLAIAIDQGAGDTGGPVPPDDVVAGHTGLFAVTQGSGRSASIFVSAPSISLGNNGVIASTLASGLSDYSASAGEIAINAGTIQADGAFFGAPVAGSGQGGSMRINANDILWRGGSLMTVATDGTGSAGAIQINARGLLEVSGSGTNFNAGPGIINSQINSSTFGSGSGGQILINAGAVVVERGRITSGTAGQGQAGSVSVVSGSIDLVNGGEIEASSRGSGRAGSVSVVASGRIAIQGVDTGTTAADGLPSASGIGSTSFGSGDAGDVRIAATAIRVSDGGRIASRATSTGRAGSIDIVASDKLELSNGGSIQTNALVSDGGNISIRAGNLVYLQGGSISTSVGGGTGGGGNIFIDPTFVILDGSSITANAFGGPGGNVTIISDYFITSPDSVVEASSQLGVSGTVQIAAPRTDPGSTLARLPAATLDASAMLRASCAGRAGPGASSFIGVGRGGVASDPAAFAGSSYFKIPEASEPPQGSRSQPGTSPPTATALLGSALLMPCVQ